MFLRVIEDWGVEIENCVMRGSHGLGFAILWELAMWTLLLSWCRFITWFGEWVHDLGVLGTCYLRWMERRLRVYLFVFFWQASLWFVWWMKITRGILYMQAWTWKYMIFFFFFSPLVIHSNTWWFLGYSTIWIEAFSSSGNTYLGHLVQFRFPIYIQFISRMTRKKKGRGLEKKDSLFSSPWSALAFPTWPFFFAPSCKPNQLVELILKRIPKSLRCRDNKRILMGTKKIK